MLSFSIPQLQKDPVSFSQEKMTGQDLLKNISYSGTVIALKIDGVLKDLSCALPSSGCIELIDRQSPEGLDILRHSAAHVLAQAVKELYPETQVTIGPVIENGFYYDFFRSTPFQEADLQTIQQRMKEIVAQNEPVIREEWDRDKAIAFFENQGEQFKAQIIRDLPANEVLSLYKQGPFTDLCRGPHLPSTGALGLGFCLTKISGAYWRGNPQNPQLQRIYGTAWASEEDLAVYLQRLQEAEKRDHRRLSREMDLFHFQEEAPGGVFWHPNGWQLYCTLRSYIRDRLIKEGYQEVNTPQLVSQSLWEASGHWAKFRQNMFALEHNDMTYALKPMNCPCHVQIFNQTPKSYRDLPLRLSEFGSCMRDEPSGALSGLMRLRSFVQDDAHIFCTPEHMVEETKSFCELLFSVYKELGFEEVIVRFSSRPDTRLGSDALWDRAEAALCEGADAAGLSYTHFPGEGAFYGPKLEFVLKDSLGRLWQCGTLQVDFVLPERLGAFYIDSDGEKKQAVMLHRAILGSMERFIGVLLEHYGGHLPFWLVPVQVIVAPISEKVYEYAKTLTQKFQEAGLRTALDARNEKIGYKIREHASKKVGCMAVVGMEEAQDGSVSLRIGSVNQKMSQEEAISYLLHAHHKKVCLTPQNL
jgi:threonyl-tRNA synthetase